MLSGARQPALAALAVLVLGAGGVYVATSDVHGETVAAQPVAATPSALPSPAQTQVGTPAPAQTKVGEPAPAQTAVGQPSPASSVGTVTTADADRPYPDAAAILAKDGIKLNSGNGGITLDKCGTNLSQIRLYSNPAPAAKQNPMYCFTVHSSTGRIALELDQVFAIDTGARPLSAKFTGKNLSATLDVAKNQYAPFGEGPQQNTGHVLVEISATG
ncbi:hypothetical protein ACFXA3_16680 [Streptomyces sp. NPDC059456]|uniref:hypothetical protein n=1 Tax=Streptomyces sp. NPDC059456 TaxID=3346838 RepID=UPI0036869384